MTTAPGLRAAIIAGMNASITWIVPIRLTSTMDRHTRCSSRSGRPQAEFPATWKIASGAPFAATTRSPNAATAS